MKLVNQLRYDNGLEDINHLPDYEFDKLWGALQEYPLKEEQESSYNPFLPPDIDDYIKFEEGIKVNEKGQPIDGIGYRFYIDYHEEMYSPTVKRIEHFYIIPGVQFTASSNVDKMLERVKEENKSIFKGKVMGTLIKKRIKLKSTEEGLVIEKLNEIIN